MLKLFTEGRTGAFLALTRFLDALDETALRKGSGVHGPSVQLPAQLLGSGLLPHLTATRCGAVGMIAYAPAAGGRCARLLTSTGSRLAPGGWNRALLTTRSQGRARARRPRAAALAVVTASYEYHGGFRLLHASTSCAAASCRRKRSGGGRHPGGPRRQEVVGGHPGTKASTVSGRRLPLRLQLDPSTSQPHRRSASHRDRQLQNASTSTGAAYTPAWQVGVRQNVLHFVVARYPDKPSSQCRDVVERARPDLLPALAHRMEGSHHGPGVTLPRCRPSGQVSGGRPALKHTCGTSSTEQPRCGSGGAERRRVDAAAASGRPLFPFVGRRTPRPCG